MTMIGHNNPPTDHEMIRETLAEKNAKAITRAKALIEAADRVPTVIEDKDTSEKITDLEKQITVCFNVLEKARTEEKAPYWEMCKVVDGFFKKDFLDVLDGAKKRIKKIQTSFLVEEERKERERRAELARQEREKAEAEAAEAAKLEQAGEVTKSEMVLDKAIQHEHDAAFFGEAAQAKGATVAASTGEMTGARTSLRYTTVAEIEDWDRLDLNLLKPYMKREDVQKALNAALKFNAANIPGVKVWEKPEAMTR